jgi:hypothetical protein
MTISPAPHQDQDHGRRRTAALALAGVLVLGVAACSAPVPGGRAAAVEPGPPLEPATTTPADAPAPPAPPEETGSGGLDRELAERFAAAQRAATADGIELRLVSGVRTAEEQQALVDQAIGKYGVPEAYRWVLPPEDSAHVQGLAIDVGPTEGTYWLVEHGLEHGLCQTYGNEVWHFELLPDGADTCPEQHADASWAW